MTCLCDLCQVLNCSFFWLNRFIVLTFSLFLCLAIVESLITKVKAWELERGVPFLYEKVVQLTVWFTIFMLPYSAFVEIFFFQAPLLHTLEEYTVLRQEREEEKRRCRVC